MSGGMMYGFGSIMSQYNQIQYLKAKEYQAKAEASFRDSTHYDLDLTATEIESPRELEGPK